MDLSFMSDNLKGFMGSGLLFTLFLASLLFLGMKLEKGIKKTMLVYFPVFALLIYFCPVWGIYMKLRDDAEILYRILWLIPMGVVIAYACIEVIDLLPRKYKNAGLIGAIILIILCGQYVYSNKQYHKAENIYHIPQTIVDICDDIVIPGREVRACFPIEMIQYVRQYTPLVCQAYGRDTLLLGAEYDEYSKVGAILNKETVDTGLLTDTLRNSDTPYLVVDKDINLSEPLLDYGYEPVRDYGEYELFLDINSAIKFDNN